VGLTETQAKKEFGDGVKIGKFPLAGNSKATILDDTNGFVKVVAEAKYGEILGIEIIGPHATELVGEAVLGMQLEATFHDFASAIHAHPTVSESIMEAALNVEGKAVHI
jgi:dihydrolipoamide dehydrogenase